MNSNKAAYLPAIGGMRVMLILLLVCYHTFAPYSMTWPPFEGMLDNYYYYVWDKFVFSIMLESFVFISGFIFGHQVCLRGNSTINLFCVIKKKGLRLFIPCVVFGVLYYMLFERSNIVSLNSLNMILSGIGHLWFLPMLFWCFIFTSSLEQIKIPKLEEYKYLEEGFKIGMVFFLPILTIFQLPLKIDAACHYMFYFYLGYIWRIKNLKISKMTMYITVILFIPFFFISDIWGGHFLNKMGLSNIYIQKTLLYGVRLFYKTFGVIAVLSLFESYYKNHVQSLFIYYVGSLCFGVYIYHQFILKGIYYSKIISIFDIGELTPWMIALTVLLLSLLFSYITLKFKFGRYLIG